MYLSAWSSTFSVRDVYSRLLIATWARRWNLVKRALARLDADVTFTPPSAFWRVIDEPMYIRTLALHSDWWRWHLPQRHRLMAFFWRRFRRIKTSPAANTKTDISLTQLPVAARYRHRRVISPDKPCVIHPVNRVGTRTCRLRTIETPVGAANVGNVSVSHDRRTDHRHRLQDTCRVHRSRASGVSRLSSLSNRCKMRDQFSNCRPVVHTLNKPTTNFDAH